MIGRRSLLVDGAASAALALPAAAPVIAGQPHPDAELLALFRKLEAAWAAERALPDDAPDDATNAAIDASGRIVDQIAATEAKTIDGLMVKARAVLWCGHEYDDIKFDLFGRTTDCRLAASVLRDLLAMGGAA